MAGEEVSLIFKILDQIEDKRVIPKVTALFDAHEVAPIEQIPLVRILEKLFLNIEHDCKGVAFRAELRKIYGELFVRSYPFPELLLTVLEKIIEGVDWTSEDRDECFQFICQTYETLRIGLLPEQTEKVRKGMLDLLRRNLKKNILHWPLKEFDLFILQEHVPPQIVLVLLKARVHLVSLNQSKQEIEFLQSFNLTERSASGIKFAHEYLKQIRQTEELAGDFVRRINGPDGLRETDGRLYAELLDSKSATTGNVMLVCSPAIVDVNDPVFEMIRRVWWDVCLNFKTAGSDHWLDLTINGFNGFEHSEQFAYLTAERNPLADD